MLVMGSEVQAYTLGGAEKSGGTHGGMTGYGTYTVKCADGTTQAAQAGTWSDLACQDHGGVAN